VPGVYAIGDVKGGPAFNAYLHDDFRILRENWLNGGTATTDGRPVPNCMYIDPQLATGRHQRNRGAETWHRLPRGEAADERVSRARRR